MKEYSDDLSYAFEQIDAGTFEALVNHMIRVYRAKKKIFVAGNGGSAATANHFVSDCGKNAVQGDRRRFRMLSLSDDIEKITAFGNDVSFDSVFAEQLKSLIDEGDLLILISASGNSPNILRAAEYARAAGSAVVSLTGFDGGRLREISDINLNTPLQTYEQVEDMHLILTHMIVSLFKTTPALLE